MIATAQFTISDLNDATNELVVGTQTSATGAWAGIANLDALRDGQEITYWLPYAGSGSATLELTLRGGTTTGAIPCYYGGTTRLTTHYGAGNVIHLTYRENVNISGTAIARGWWADANYDSNNFDRVKMNNSITAKSAISSSRFIVSDSDGYFHLAAGTAFDVTKPILWSGSAIAADATGTNNYLSYPSCTLRNNHSGFTGTQGETCYIPGTLSGQRFTPAAELFTTTIPTTDDGLTYIALGYMASTYQVYLYPEHPVYRYIDGSFKSLPQIACEAKEKIDKLEVGGKNLLLNTRSMAGYELTENISVQEDGEGFAVASFLSDGSTEERCSLKPRRAYSLLRGRKVMLSFWVKCDDYAQLIANSFSGVTAGFVIEYRAIPTNAAQTVNAFTMLKSSLLSDKWQRLTLTFKFNDPYGSASITFPENATFYVRIAVKSAYRIDVKKVKLEYGDMATDWTPAPEDADEALEMKLASVSAQITTATDSIRQEVQANYAASTALTQVQQQLSTLSEQTQTNFTWSVSQINGIIADAQARGEATDSQLDMLRTYMTFAEDGLTIGKTGNPFTFRVVNDRLAFYMNNTEVAYLSNNKLYVTQAEILTKLQIGKFAFEPQSNGNLSMIYTG